MQPKLRELYKDEQGTVYVEIALAIIILVFAISPNLTSLGQTTGTKVGEIESKISAVGTP